MNRKRLTYINILLMFCAMACLLYYDIRGRLWLKGITSSWFVLLGGINLWAARKLKGRKFLFCLLVEAALLCGMCADVLLGMVFFAGVAVFALGHVLYLIAFCILEGFSRKDLLFILPLALLSIFFATGTPWITVADPVLKKLLVGYAVIISAMLGKALSNLIRKPCRFRRLLAVGCVLFWFSDLMLAIDMFGQASRLTWILCSYSYWPAQNLLAHSLFHTGDDAGANCL